MIDDRNGLLIQKDSLAIIIIAGNFKYKYSKSKGMIYKLRPGSQYACCNGIRVVY